MSFIEGVGGAFLFSPDPVRLARWYVDHLGLTWDGPKDKPPFYVAFKTKSIEDPSREIDTSFSILTLKVPPPPRPSGPEKTNMDDMYGDQPFMVNLRVRDMDALIAHLESKGVRILARQDESYGRFAWVRDADGNRVELYQAMN